MSRRSWQNLLRKLATQPRPDQRSSVRLSVEQLEELTLPSGGKAFPTIVLSAHRSNGSGIHHQDGPGSSALTPAQIRGAYGIDSITFNGVVGTGAGQTIAIVDAYDDPNIVSDLTAFDKFYGLQTMNGAGGTAGNPTFTKIGVDSAGNGSTTSFPTPDGGWAGEIALDVEWSHVVAPKANIVLVEGASATNSDLLTAVGYAATKTGASAVSMSWGESEFFGEDQYDSYFSTPGVTFFASSGDSGSPIIWPAASSHVVGTGGTSLSVGAGNTYGGESGWSGSGGGLSSVIAAPSYQNGLVISDGFGGTTDAGGMRASPDVAYNSDPNTGVGILDTYGFGGWVIIGGTSAASPQWAGLMAIVNQGRALAGQSPLSGFSQTLPALYQLPSADFHDVTSGFNGGYFAGPGYDLVTGLGSPVANLLVPALAGYSPGNPPTITSGASFSPAPGGTTGQLAVSATANPTSDPLIYTWSLTGTPPAAVSFSSNGTTTSNNTTATFSKIGTYTFLVTVTDTTDGLFATSSVTVTIAAQVSSITVSPNTVSLYDGKTQQFAATAFDQFGAALASQPSFSWTVTTGTATGSVTTGGLYAAPGVGTGSANVQATAAGVNGSATANFSPAPAPPTITTLRATPGLTTATLVVVAADTGGMITSYTWIVTSAPAGAPAVSYSDNGSFTASTTTVTFGAAGAYTFQVTVLDSNNQSATGSVTVTITPVLSYVVVTPANVTLAPSATQQFSAAAQDQFHNAFSNPPSTAWSATGTITAGGMYTAPSTAGTDTVTATIGTVKGTAAVTIASNSGVLFSDDFSAGLGKWTIDSGNYFVTVYHGTPRLRSSSYYSGINRIVAGSSSWTNYSFQGVMTFINVSGSASLLARVVDDNHLYFFSYNGAYGVWQIAAKEGVNTTVVLASSNYYPAYTYTDYTVQANLYGSHLSLYVNGVLEVSVNDSTYASGKIGFSTTFATALLGNVVVTALNGPLTSRQVVGGGSSSLPAANHSQGHSAPPARGAFVSGFAPWGNQLFSSAFSFSGWSLPSDLATALGDPFWDIFGGFGK
jgi:hypothetical protein